MTNGMKRLEDYARERSPEKHAAHIKKRGGSGKVSFAVVRDKTNKAAAEAATNKKSPTSNNHEDNGLNQKQTTSPRRYSNK
jgi:hypothetical protein